MEQYAIELDGLTYRFAGNRLEEIGDLKELAGVKRLVTDMQDAISRTMTIDAAHKYVDVVVRKKLQESGAFDDAISLIPHLKKKKGKNTAELFFTALPSRLFSYYMDLIREQEDILLIKAIEQKFYSIIPEHLFYVKGKMTLRRNFNFSYGRVLPAPTPGQGFVQLGPEGHPVTNGENQAWFEGIQHVLAHPQAQPAWRVG